MDGIDLDGEIDIEQLGLPVSNTENKLLEAEVQRKQKEVSVHQTKIDQHADRTQAISEHLKNVKQELHHTQVSTDRISVLHCCVHWWNLMPNLFPKKETT